jgi:choline-sulfatase
MADQLAAPQLKMYNPDSQIMTPNLDALAANSVQFDSAYCPSPLCAPSRMSLITGLLPMKIGAYDNASQVGSDWPTYAHYLRLKGYNTALAGKMHFVGDQLHGYETRLTSDVYPGDFGWAVNWEEPDRRLEWYHNASSILQAGSCVRSNQLDYDEEVMYKSTQFLYDQVREGPKSRPFCLTVSTRNPHVKQEKEDETRMRRSALPEIPGPGPIYRAGKAATSSCKLLQTPANSCILQNLPPTHTHLYDDMAIRNWLYFGANSEPPRH